jgi:hypothetical protein
MFHNRITKQNNTLSGYQFENLFQVIQKSEKYRSSLFRSQKLFNLRYSLDQTTLLKQ